MDHVILSSGYLVIKEIRKTPPPSAFFFRGLHVGEVLRIDYKLKPLERDDEKGVFLPEVFVYNMTTGKHTVMKHNFLVKVLKCFVFSVGMYKGNVFDNPNRDLKYNDSDYKEWKPIDIDNL